MCCPPRETNDSVVSSPGATSLTSEESLLCLFARLHDTIRCVSRIREYIPTRYHGMIESRSTAKDTSIIKVER